MKRLTVAALLFFMLLVFPCLSTAATENHADKVEKVWNWVLSQPTIRIYFDNTYGFGHQSSSLRIVKKLLKKGYQGRFDFVAHDAENSKETFEKVKHFLSGMDLDPRRIDWSTLDTLETSVPLTLTGGNDHPNNYGNFTDFYPLLQTRVLINLQPPHWRRSNQILYPSSKRDRKLEILNLNVQDLEICPECDENIQADAQIQQLFKDYTVIPLYADERIIRHNMPTFIKATYEAYKLTAGLKPLLFLALNTHSYPEIYKETVGTKIFTSLPEFKEAAPTEPSVLVLPFSSQALFTWIITHTETFAGVAGVNSEAAIMKAGKPFLKLSLDPQIQSFLERFRPARGSDYSKARRAFHSALEGFSRKHPEDMKEFLLQSFDPNSQLHAFFKATGENYRQRNADDKLEEAFKAFAETQEFERISSSSWRQLVLKLKNICETWLL